MKDYVKETQKYNNIDWSKYKNAIVIIPDIIAFSISYYFALVIRFWKYADFDELAKPFLPIFKSFTPIYIVLAIIVFYIFKLYFGVWRYAGVNDFVRITEANFVTYVIYILATLFFYRRMPISYYGLGFFFQWCITVGARFLFHILSVYSEKYSRRNLKMINAMIIGANNSTNIAINYLERNVYDRTRAVCIINTENGGRGRSMEGIPVYAGIETIEKCIEKYAVDYILIVETDLDTESRNFITNLAKKHNITVQDFSLIMRDSNQNVYFHPLMGRIMGRVNILYNGDVFGYSNPYDAEKKFPGRYIVKSVQAENGVVTIEIEDDTIANITRDTEWMNQYKEQTGEEISFF